MGIIREYTVLFTGGESREFEPVFFHVKMPSPYSYALHLEIDSAPFKSLTNTHREIPLGFVTLFVLTKYNWHTGWVKRIFHAPEKFFALSFLFFRETFAPSNFATKKSLLLI